MFKKIMLVCLLVLGVGIGGSGAADFNPVYDKGPDCFMSLDYEGSKGLAASALFINQDLPDYGRKYLRNDGRLWRETGMGAVETIPVFLGKSVGPAWYCQAPKPEPVVYVAPEPEFEPKSFVVFFDFDKDEIREDQVAILEEASAYAAEFGEASIYLDAFCDFRGSDEYNVDLGARRAEAVANWMIANGIDPNQFGKTFNYGDSESPVRDLEGVYCAECWQDRKVEISIEE